MKNLNLGGKLKRKEGPPITGDEANSSPRDKARTGTGTIKRKKHGLYSASIEVETEDTAPKGGKNLRLGMTEDSATC